MIADALIQTIQSIALLVWQRAISVKWRQQAGSERRVDFLEYLQKSQADGIALADESIAARMGDLLHLPFGSQLGTVIAERGQRIFRRPECIECRGVEIGRGESAVGGDIGEPHQRGHHGELPRVIELETGYPPAVGKNLGLGELAQLTAVDEYFQDILLDVVVVVDDLGQTSRQRPVYDRDPNAVRRTY